MDKIYKALYDSLVITRDCYKTFSVGGSLALHKFFFNHPAIKPNDVDIFIWRPELSPVMFTELLLLKGFHSVKISLAYKEDFFKFDSQIALVKAEHSNGTQVDFIFMGGAPTDVILPTSLANIQYFCNPACKNEYVYFNGLTNPNIASELVNSREVWAREEECTPEQIEKLRHRCKALGLYYIEAETGPEEVFFE